MKICIKRTFANIKKIAIILYKKKEVKVKYYLIE